MRQRRCLLLDWCCDLNRCSSLDGRTYRGQRWSYGQDGDHFRSRLRIDDRRDVTVVAVVGIIKRELLFSADAEVVERAVISLWLTKHFPFRQSSKLGLLLLNATCSLSLLCRNTNMGSGKVLLITSTPFRPCRKQQKTCNHPLSAHADCLTSQGFGLSSCDR